MKESGTGEWQSGNSRTPENKDCFPLHLGIDWLCSTEVVELSESFEALRRVQDAKRRQIVPSKNHMCRLVECKQKKKKKEALWDL